MQFLKPGQLFYKELPIRNGGKLIAPDSAPTAYVYYKNAKDVSVFPLTVGAPTATGLYPVTGITSSSYASLDHVECWTDFTVAGVSYSFQFDEIVILTFAAGAPLAGAGSNSCTLSFTDSSTGRPLANASVWVSSDSAGKSVVAGALPTNALGKVTFLLTAGTTYYVWMTDAGENSINGQAFVAVAD